MNALTSAQLEQLRRLSTCVAASAIETFGVRVRNTGFANSPIRCIFPDFPPIIGYAVTARIRSSEPPMEGGTYDRGRKHYDQTDWWKHILTIPAPRVVVIQDLDKTPGLGAFLGEVHTNILTALGCVGALTNGSVRDLPQVREAGFQMFAASISVSHAYAHLFDFGGEVEIERMQIAPGDLILGDVHGVVTIPGEVAAELNAVAQKILSRRRSLVELCRSAEFSLENLKKALQQPEE